MIEFNLEATPNDNRGRLCANPSSINEAAVGQIVYRAVHDNEHNLSFDKSFDYLLAGDMALESGLQGQLRDDLDGPNASTDIPFTRELGGISGFDSIAPFSSAYHAERIIGQGIIEVGVNRGALIDRMLQFCGAQPGNPYCAAGVSWCFHLATGKLANQGGFPTSASSQEIRRWFEKQGLASTNVNDLLRWRGALFGWTKQSDFNTGHIGIILNLIVEGGQVVELITAEFNTSASGALTKEGNGSFIKKRKPLAHFWYLNTSSIPGGSWWDDRP